MTNEDYFRLMPKNWRETILLPNKITWEDRNGATVEDFHQFCKENPQLRFWQALCAWSGQTVFLNDRSKEGYHMNLTNATDFDEHNFFMDCKDVFYREGFDGKTATPERNK
jgi:hypothetical protein